MTDYPVIMSGPMVKALLREIEQPGTGKTQTRRLAWRLTTHQGRYCEAPTIWQKVEPGDRLWVRETWGVDCRGDSSPVRGGQPYDPVLLFRERDSAPTTPQWETFRWHPSIHMRRRDSRITLVVTATKMEPVQAISDVDVVAEGVDVPDWKLIDRIGVTRTAGADLFRPLWNTLHTKPGTTWQDNPTVVAITGTVHMKNIDQMEAAA